MAMTVSHSCEEAEFTRLASSRDNRRHSCARAHGRRSAAHQEAIAEERKQRRRSKTRKQRIRSKTRNSDRRDKWEELHTLEVHTAEVPEEIPGSPQAPLVDDSMVEVARFSDRATGKRRGRDGGWFLVVDPATRMAALQRYQSRDGCESCDWNLLSSDDGVSEALEPALELAVPCLEMYRRAKLCVDPKLTLRRMRKDDLGYDAVMALYASYLVFHEQTFLAGERQPSSCPWPEWKCHRWSGRAVRGVVKVQALWRGFYFRKRVLFNPHTAIGRRFLERQWQRLQLDPFLPCKDSTSSL
ncbi:hypothetical protein KC19_2G011100 [Ceratodon purpureus]|uniref:Uncharacterized protein n=1 Tax=Ceratodon purpureus TaxID=3225 RepID=A0A8T0IRK7_CERPU|nr:hypothetical protein KC19_2G011100 [Ceratodon purpureus]